MILLLSKEPNVLENALVPVKNAAVLTTPKKQAGSATLSPLYKEEIPAIMAGLVDIAVLRGLMSINHHLLAKRAKEL